MLVAESTRQIPGTDQPKGPAYSVRVENYKSDNGTEPLLMLGLSHQDSESTHRRTAWMYQNNPAGQAIVCTVRHNKSERDIGVLALCRRQIKTPEGIKDAGIFCDLVADKAHRTLGPAIQLMQAALDTAKPMQLKSIYGWPNEKSVVLFKRFPSAELGQVGIFRRYFNWQSIFSERMPKLPAMLLGAAVNVVDKASQWVHQRILERFYQVREITSFDENFDELWSIASTRYDEIGVRNAEFLNWRFCGSSETTHQILALFSRKTSKPVGYIVYRKLNDTSVEISDFLATNSQFTERSVIRAFCNHVRAIGYEKVSIHYTGNSTTARNLWTCGFIKVGSQVAIHFQFADDQIPPSKRRTHVTQADHDVG